MNFKQVCIHAVSLLGMLGATMACITGIARPSVKVPVLYHCTIDDSQRQSGLPRACIVPATCETNARRIAEDRCHWHGKTFYCVPMTQNYPDIIQMEITP